MFGKSRFADLLQNIPKSTFIDSVTQHKSDRYAKTFKSWDLLLLILYGQIKQVDSLRTLITGYNAHESHHYHLNTHAVRRSTVADATSLSELMIELRHNLFKSERIDRYYYQKQRD